MAIQPFIRRRTRSNATARRLIEASARVAPHILKSTIEDVSVAQPVQRCVARQATMLAGLPVMAHQAFYLVRSKFAGRCYVVVRNRRMGAWMCSSKDVEAMCISRVRTYIDVLKSRKAA
jgi:hypothetical protein